MKLNFNYNIVVNCPNVCGIQSFYNNFFASNIYTKLLNSCLVFLFNIFSFNIISSFVENSLIDVISQDKFYIRTQPYDPLHQVKDECKRHNQTEINLRCFLKHNKSFKCNVWMAAFSYYSQKLSGNSLLSDYLNDSW